MNPGTWKLALMCLGLALMCIVSAPDASAAPSLAVNPALGAPGSTVRVSGSGFCGTCPGVTIKFNATAVASGVEVTPDGHFSASVRVPGDALTGPAQFVATQKANGRTLSAAGLFTVTVSLVAAPTTASVSHTAPATTPTSSPRTTLPAPAPTPPPAAAFVVTPTPIPVATVSASRVTSTPPAPSSPVPSVVPSFVVEAPSPATTDESMVIEVHSHAGRVFLTWIGSTLAALLAASALLSRLRPKLAPGLGSGLASRLRRR